MNWKDQKVFITGGAGFIGSHLADRLVELGGDVTLSDIFTPRNSRNVEHLEGKITKINLDITNSISLDNSFDYIFHMAGITSAYEFEKNPDLGFKTNVEGTRNVLEFATKNEIKKFVFPSTAFVYGKHPKYIPIDEKHPINASDNSYSLSKLQGEELCNSFIRLHNLPIVILRLFSTFGPRQPKEYFFPTVILQAIKSKSVEIWSEIPKRDFVFVDDTVNAFIKAAESDFVGGPINIGSGREVSTGEIGRSIANQLMAEFRSLGRDVIGPQRLLCDYSLAKNILNWEPETSFEEGLKKTINWFSQNHHLY